MKPSTKTPSRALGMQVGTQPKVAIMLDSPNIIHIFKQIPAMWLFISMCPFIPADLCFPSKLHYRCK